MLEELEELASQVNNLIPLLGLFQGLSSVLSVCRMSSSSPLTCLCLMRFVYSYCRPSKFLYSPAWLKNSSSKKSRNFATIQGCHYPLFYVMISSNFRKVKAKNLNSGPCILIFLVLGTNPPAAYRLSKH